MQANNLPDFSQLTSAHLIQRVWSPVACCNFRNLPQGALYRTVSFSRTTHQSNYTPTAFQVRNGLHGTLFGWQVSEQNDYSLVVIYVILRPKTKEDSDWVRNLLGYVSWFYAVTFISLFICLKYENESKQPHSHPWVLRWITLLSAWFSSWSFHQNWNTHTHSESHRDSLHYSIDACRGKTGQR